MSKSMLLIIFWSFTFAQRRSSIVAVDCPSEITDWTIQQSSPAAKASTTPPKAITKDVDAWGLDVFSLKNFPLTAVVLKIFEKRDLVGMDRNVLSDLLMDIEEQYFKTVPYHTSQHAADAAQTVHYMLELENFNKAFTPLEKAATIIAAASHDVGHPGFTNPFLKATCQAPSNTGSILEERHWFLTNATIENHKLLAKLNDNDRTTFMDIVKQLLENKITDDKLAHILSTDNAHHDSLTASLKNISEIMSSSHADDKLIVLKGILHFADISNPTKPFRIYKIWIDRVLREFRLQEDIELDESKLKNTTTFDKYKKTVPETQIGFINFLVKGTVDQMLRLAGKSSNSDLIGDHLEENLKIMVLLNSTDACSTVKDCVSKLKTDVKMLLEALMPKLDNKVNKKVSKVVQELKQGTKDEGIIALKDLQISAKVVSLSDADKYYMYVDIYNQVAKFPTAEVEQHYYQTVKSILLELSPDTISSDYIRVLLSSMTISLNGLNSKASGTETTNSGAKLIIQNQFWAHLLSIMLAFYVLQIDKLSS